MLTEAEMRARVQQMIDTDPYGPEAAALLQRISLFKGPLNRSLIMILAPKGMPREMRMQALMVLIRWGFATKDVDHEVFLSDGLQSLFPLDETVIDALLIALEFSVSLDWFVYSAEGLDLLVFCTTYLDRNPTAILRLMDTAHIYGPALIERAFAILEHVPDPSAGLWSLYLIASHQKDLLFKQRVFEKLIEFYNDHQSKPQLQGVLIMQGNNAKDLNDTPLMLRAYAQAVALDPTSQHIKLSVLSTLLDAALQDEKRETALHYFAQAQDWVVQRQDDPPGRRNGYMAGLARMAQSLGLYETARDCYAHATHLWESAELLWYWAEFECKHGQHEVGCRLFALSMTVLWKNMMASEVHAPYRDISKLWEIRRQAILAMGCEDCPI